MAFPPSLSPVHHGTQWSNLPALLYSSHSKQLLNFRSLPRPQGTALLTSQEKYFKSQQPIVMKPNKMQSITRRPPFPLSRPRVAIIIPNLKFESSLLYSLEVIDCDRFHSFGGEVSIDEPINDKLAVSWAWIIPSLNTWHYNSFKLFHCEINTIPSPCSFISQTLPSNKRWENGPPTCHGSTKAHFSVSVCSVGD